MRIGASLDPQGSRPIEAEAELLFLLPTGEPRERQAVVRINEVTVVLTAVRRPFHNISDFTRLQLHIPSFKLLVVKSGYLSPELAPLANPNLMALSDGSILQDLDKLPKNQFRPPTFPFDRSFTLAARHYRVRQIAAGDRMKRPLLEVSIEGVDGLLVAQDNGADRVELCASVLEGGITPSIGIVREALRRARVPVFVIVRPRGGDFLYSESEFESMRQDVIALKELGVPGVVSGCLTAGAEVDEQRTAELLRLARPMSFTFHRAFDMVRDPLQALEVLIKPGCGPAADQRSKGHCDRGLGQPQAAGSVGKRAHDRYALRWASCRQYRPGVPGNRTMGTALCRS